MAEEELTSYEMLVKKGEANARPPSYATKSNDINI